MTRGWGYTLFALATLGLAVLSVLSSFILNPPTLLFLEAAAPAVRLLGRTPPIYGFSSMGSFVAMSLVWPLSLAPLHWLNYGRLKRRHWSYFGLVLLANLAAAFAILWFNAGPKP